MGLWSWFASLFHKKPIVVQGDTKMAKRALLVGINAYPGAKLEGCVNDVKNIYNILVTKYGFNPSQIYMLLDKEATTANILSKLNWLVSVNPGDTILFWFSGHGSQLVAKNDASEIDGLYECICPVDFDFSRGHAIIDKQFVDIFSKIPSGCIFNWGNDSCHSGNLTREIPKKPKTFFASLWHKIAFWKKEITQNPKHFPLTAHILEQIRKAKQKGHKTRALVGGILDVGFVSGCQSNQTSADAFIGGQHCGAMTYYFTKKLQENPSGALVELVAATNRDLAANGYDQRPSAEGARINKPFLG